MKQNPNAAGGSKATDYFIAVSTLYLILPNLLFLLTWVRPIIGIAAALLVGWSWTRFALLDDRMQPSRRRLDRNTMLLVIFAGLGWIALSGVGGFLPRLDYTKHELVFHDLASQRWPVTYEDSHGKSYLCYAIGYYLLPSLGMRAFGEAALPLLSFAWTGIGICLFFYWIATLNKASKTFLLVFLFYAGWAIVWLWIKGGAGIGQTPTSARINDAGLFHNYLDSWDKLEDAPQHATAAWLATAVLHDLLWVKGDPRGAGLVWTSVLLWSPFSAIGLLLLPLITIKRIRLAEWFSLTNLLGGGALLLIMGIYFSGHLKLEISGPIWTVSKTPMWPVYYCLYIVTQLFPAFCVLLLDQKYRLLSDFKPLFLGAVATLLLLPLYKAGWNNDLRLQASAPALVITALAVALCFSHEAFSPRRPLCFLLVVAFCVGAIYPTVRPFHNLATNHQRYRYDYVSSVLGIHHIVDLGILWHSYDGAAQCLGSQDSPAYRWLLK